MNVCDIQTPEDLVTYILTYQKEIFVREKVDDKWLPVPLSELSPRSMAQRMLGFLEQGIVPVRVINLDVQVLNKEPE